MSRVFNVILAAVVVMLAFGNAGNGSYADAIELWTEEKLARVERVRREPRARIWSKRCERRDMDSIAFQADDRPMEIRCVERRVLQVPAEPV